MSVFPGPLRVSASLRALLLCLLALSLRAQTPDSAVPLPPGVKAVWDLTKAWHASTPTRERICLNGLWRWQPAGISTEQVPTGEWGYFKVPGCWPGITDYMQKDCQTVYAHPASKEQKMGGLTAAWYQREIAIPTNWTGRQILAQVDCLNSYATVFIDGKKVGEVRFPAGEVDLTAACPPGGTHLLSMLVVAMPMKGVLLSYTDSAHAREVKGSVPRRGLCGDVFLLARPPGAHLRDVAVEPSVRRKEITFSTALEGLDPNIRYKLRARVSAGGVTLKEFTSPAVSASELREGRFRFASSWLPEKLWDLHSAQNILAAELTLVDAKGQAVDVQFGTRFGFREMWIEGRDFFFNGTRLHLSAVPLDNAQISAGLATYAAAKETLQRLKAIGINLVYTHHYGCEPGAHLSLEEILRAADDVGMLVSVTQPHFSHYDWKAGDADEKNGYAAHAAYYAQVAASHPSVVMYAMSHNATGYEEDMNPDLIDGLHDPRDNWSSKNAKLALRAEAIVQRLDPSRIVYHHASGNLGSMHVMNFYPNFVPIQELSDWYEHWSKEGVKPAFMCEYGAPFTWDWTMYRGWYRGQREFGSANVPWEFCLAEWNAQLLGDRAYQISEAEKTNLRWEARQFRTGNGWHRWDYPNQVDSERFEERYPVFARYLTDNWRAFRTWGVSAISPWEYGHYWKLREGVDRRPVECKVDWNALQWPGFSPDYENQRMERMDIAFQDTDWVATPAAHALNENNGPLLGYIGGKAEAFTSKDHNFLPGEIVEKQFILINDSREPVKCESRWSLARMPDVFSGANANLVAPGGQERVPFHVSLPKELEPGRYEIRASFKFDRGEPQYDSFWIDVLRPPGPLQPVASIAVFDPKGDTQRLLDRLGLKTQPVTAEADLSPYEMLIVGKAALTATNPAPDISRVRDGLKVILFEQTSEVLEKRFGFRVEEYGLRQVFPRVPDHPALAGLSTESLRDWRGAATILPSRLAYDLVPMHGPTVQWCGLPVSRLWRCGNRGNVASVLIEKPANGDFLSLLDGGYGLHYSTLLEYREGRGMLLFCQTDVTARTESDPAAETLTRHLLAHAAAWQPPTRRMAAYLGEPAGLTHLEATGVAARAYDGGKLAPSDMLIVAPSGGRDLHSHAANIAGWLKAGGHLLAVGLDQTEAEALLPFKVSIKKKEHIAASFEPPRKDSLLAGIGPAEVYNRDPRDLPLIADGAQVLGDGVVAQAENLNVVFCQMVPWQFDGSHPSNLKRTHRQSSILLSRLLANMGVSTTTPILERFHHPLDSATPEQRWLKGLYLDRPEEWDDPYRFFRW